jgi:hypothetical protein
MPVLLSAPFSCYCSKAFNVKNHILCETVSFDQWYSIMDTADKYGITIYVHELCKFPFVKTLGQTKTQYYLPGTIRCALSEIEETS